MSDVSLVATERKSHVTTDDEFAGNEDVSLYETPRLTVTDVSPMSTTNLAAPSVRPVRSLSSLAGSSSGTKSDGTSGPQARIVNSRSFPPTAPTTVGALSSPGRSPSSPKSPGSPKLEDAHFRVRTPFNPRSPHAEAQDETIYEEFVTPRKGSGGSGNSLPADGSETVIRFLQQQVEQYWADIFAKSTRITEQEALIEEKTRENSKMRNELEQYREQSAAREAEVTLQRAELVRLRAQLAAGASFSSSSAAGSLHPQEGEPATEVDRLRAANMTMAAELERARQQAQDTKSVQTAMLEELQAKTKSLEDELALAKQSTGSFARRLNGLLSRVAFSNSVQPPPTPPAAAVAVRPPTAAADALAASTTSTDYNLRASAPARLPSEPSESAVAPDDHQRDAAPTAGGQTSGGAAEAPLGNVAICFTDIEGSTEKWESNPELMSRALTLHNDLTRRLIRDTKGYEVKTEGDSFMIAWPDALDAVIFSVRLELELMTIDWPEEMLAVWPDLREVRDPNGGLLWRGLRVRVGLHYGCPAPHVDPLSGRMDYLGVVVNRASRISHLAAPGQVLLSGEMAALVSPRLGPEVILKPLGNFSFKGVAEELAVFSCTPLPLVERVFAPAAVGQPTPPHTIDKSINELSRENEKLRTALETLEKDLQSVLVNTEAVQKQMTYAAGRSVPSRSKAALTEQLRGLQKKVSVFRDESVRIREHLLEVVQQKRALIAERDMLSRRLASYEGTARPQDKKADGSMLNRDKNPLPAVGQQPRLTLGHNRTPSFDGQQQGADFTTTLPLLATDKLSPRDGGDRTGTSQKDAASRTKLSPREAEQRSRDYETSLTRHPSLDLADKRERDRLHQERAIAPPRRQSTQPVNINIIPLQLERKSSFDSRRPDSLPPAALPPAARSRDPSPNGGRRRSIVEFGGASTSIKVTKL